VIAPVLYLPFVLPTIADTGTVTPGTVLKGFGHEEVFRPEGDSREWRVVRWGWERVRGLPAEFSCGLTAIDPPSIPGGVEGDATIEAPVKAAASVKIATASKRVATTKPACVRVTVKLAD
jgi:hypothetical protein